MKKINQIEKEIEELEKEYNSKLEEYRKDFRVWIDFYSLRLILEELRQNKMSYETKVKTFCDEILKLQNKHNI